MTAGADSIEVALGNGDDTVTASDNCLITLRNGANNVTAGSYSTIKLGNGADAVTAGANSIIAVGNGADNVTVGPGSTITFGSGTDTVTAISSLINGEPVMIPLCLRAVSVRIRSQTSVRSMIPLRWLMSLFANFGAVQSDMTQVGANAVDCV